MAYGRTNIFTPGNNANRFPQKETHWCTILAVITLSGQRSLVRKAIHDATKRTQEFCTSRQFITRHSFTRGISTISSTTRQNALDGSQSVTKFRMSIADQLAAAVSDDLLVDLCFIHRCSLPVDSGEYEPKNESQHGLQGDEGEGNAVAKEVARLLVASIDLCGHCSTQGANRDDNRRADRSSSQRRTRNTRHARDHERQALTSYC